MFVIHQNRGRKPVHAYLRGERVVNLKRSEKYALANFSHFQKLLEEHESTHLSKLALGLELLCRAKSIANYRQISIYKTLLTG